MVSGFCDFKWSRIYLQTNHLAKVHQTLPVCVLILTVAMQFEFTFASYPKAQVQG